MSDPELGLEIPEGHVPTARERPVFRDSPVQLSANPLTAVYGKLDDVTTCARCVFLITTIPSRSVFKCTKGRMSRSEATDHRKGWPACGLYQARP